MTYVLVGQADVAYVGITRLDHLLGPRGLPPCVKQEVGGLETLGTILRRSLWSSNRSPHLVTWLMLGVWAYREGVVGEHLLAVGGQSRQGTARAARLVLLDVLQHQAHSHSREEF